MVVAGESRFSYGMSDMFDREAIVATLGVNKIEAGTLPSRQSNHGRWACRARTHGTRVDVPTERRGIRLAK